MANAKRILLIDPAEASRESLASRLATLGYEVATANDGAQGAYMALEDPPHAVVADLFMPSISGAQLCRLLNAEPATAEVPVILRGQEVHRNRFWAEQTGALAYVVKGRMGDLVRALQRGFASSTNDDGFFTAYSSDAGDVRDRVAHYLDAALFASVIAAEVRNLAVCESFDTLFDLFAQFTSQVTNYRWLSVVTDMPFRGGLHARPGNVDLARKEAEKSLGLKDDNHLVVVADDDAALDQDGPEPLVRPILFGETRLGALAMAPRQASLDEDVELIDILANELGGALRTATLVEESRRLARFDSLTGLFNRRAFSESADKEISRAKRHAGALSAILMDVDHFKSINDTHGHASGDKVLQMMGTLLSSSARAHDICARWGGEEFVVLLPDADQPNAKLVAERTRQAIEEMEVVSDDGVKIPVTASLGVTTLRPSDTIDTFLDRADKAMYVAKTSGRNLVCTDASPVPNAPATEDSKKETDTAPPTSEEQADSAPQPELDADAANDAKNEVA